MTLSRASFLQDSRQVVSVAGRTWYSAAYLSSHSKPRACSFHPVHACIAELWKGNSGNGLRRRREITAPLGFPVPMEEEEGVVH